MTKRILISLAMLVALILSPVGPLFAQDGRQIENSRASINRQSDQRIIVTQRSAGQLRTEMAALYDEAEATFRFMAGYGIAKDGIQKIGYEGISDVLAQLAESRKQFEALPDGFLQTMNDSYPNNVTLERLTFSLRKMRSDPGFQSALEKAEKWFNSGNKNISSVEALRPGFRSSTSAPAFLRQTCDFGDLNNYPGAADIGITQGVELVVDVVLMTVEESVGNNVPNPVYFIAVAAKAIVAAVLLGLEVARDGGLWCHDMAFDIQAALTTDGQFLVSYLLPHSRGGYIDYVKDFVTAVIQKATANNIPTNCASIRLAEADNYSNLHDWSNAYKKYRTAYANIAADACLEQ